MEPEKQHKQKPLAQTDSHITTLLINYQTLFETPHSLPPTSQHDHHIPLLDPTQTVNVKPYRYPHFQKTKS